MNLKDYIIDVQDYPKKGVVFKDITPLLNNAEAYQEVINKFADFVKKSKANVIVAPEARGFLFAPAIAYATNTRMVLVRKPNKLPRPVYEEEFSLEYGTDKLQMHIDDIKEHDKVVIIDDVLATGGTVEAIIKLVHKTPNVDIVGISFLIDLKNLHKCEISSKYNFISLIEYN